MQRITDLSDKQLRKNLKRRFYSTLMFPCLLMVLFLLATAYRRNANMILVAGNMIYYTIPIIVLLICLGSVVVRKSFYLRTAEVEFQNDKVIIKSKNKEKTYPLSKFKMIAVSNMREDPFSKSKTTFIVLCSAGVFGLFRKYVLVRDVAFENREAAIAEIQSKVNLPVKVLNLLGF